MMYGYDEVLALESQAREIDLVRPDRNALALDRSLWRLLQQACQGDRAATCEIFGLKDATALAIANAPIDNLLELASGVVFSFCIHDLERTTGEFEAILSEDCQAYEGEMLHLGPEAVFELRYWRAVQLMAVRDPYIAKATTDMSSRLLQALENASDAQLSKLAQTNMRLSLRCSEQVICEILQEARSETRTQLRLKKIQQCITPKSAKFGTIETVPDAHNKPPPHCSTESATQRALIGRLMHISGFVTRVIGLETALTYKQIINITTHIKQEGIEVKKPKSRALRTGASLIYNYATKAQSSLLMQLYINIGGPDVHEETNINALIRAYKLYCSLRQEIKEMRNGRWELFDINDAWGLVSELRRSADAAMAGYCKTCNCSYFSSAAQRTYIECPYCRPVERPPSANLDGDAVQAKTSHRLPNGLPISSAEGLSISLPVMDADARCTRTHTRHANYILPPHSLGTSPRTA